LSFLSCVIALLLLISTTAISSQFKVTRVCDGDTITWVWDLETNDDTISLEDAACGYKGLMVIERCF
jgi:hypothetical protein